MYADGWGHSSANKKRETLLWFTFRFLLALNRYFPTSLYTTRRMPLLFTWSIAEVWLV